MDSQKKTVLLADIIYNISIVRMILLQYTLYIAEHACRYFLYDINCTVDLHVHCTSMKSIQCEIFLSLFTHRNMLSYFTYKVNKMKLNGKWYR